MVGPSGMQAYLGPRPAWAVRLICSRKSWSQVESTAERVGVKQWERV